jgi:hypothetical protein
VLGLLFPITTFEGALITTLVALGAILAFLLGYLGRLGENISGRVSILEMVTPMALIYKVLFPSISTFETPPG